MTRLLCLGKALYTTQPNSVQVRSALPWIGTLSSAKNVHFTKVCLDLSRQYNVSATSWLGKTCSNTLWLGSKYTRPHFFPWRANTNSNPKQSPTPRSKMQWIKHPNFVATSLWTQRTTSNFKNFKNLAPRIKLSYDWLSMALIPKLTQRIIRNKTSIDEM